MDAPESKSLPENAYQTLAPGETYEPVVSAEEAPPEVTARSLVWGLVFCVVFTVASAYSGLKVGQVMEAAIPISILAIGLARLYQRRSHLLENVIITAIGGVAGGVVAGAIFTLPALYSLGLHPHPVQTIFICLAGACLGILFIIPLRRYFVKEMHGKFPFPEATAITEVLVTGEKGGAQAKLLIQATVISGIYDFFVTTFNVWKEYVDFQFLPVMKAAAEKAKVIVKFDAIAFILGLGYVMGIRSSMLLCAGGFLANFVLVPIIWMVGRHLPDAVYPGTVPIPQMTAAMIFAKYVRLVGVGAIATAGIFGIVKSLKIVAGSFGIAAKAFRGGGAASMERTDRDISVMALLLGTVLSAVGIAAFYGTLGAPWTVVGIALILTLVFSFFFASVAANAIATTARNPVSGMTMLTIIVSSVVLLRFGLSGTTGMFFVMALAGMVCTALSISGQMITDLKTGYWLGSTPAAQEKVKFYGAIAASIAVGLTIVMLARVYQFGEKAPGDAREVLAAPQASIMKAIVEGFMNRQPIAYFLFGTGAAIAIILEMVKVPALTFALGMYLPLELNTPALVGGIISYYVTRKSELAGGETGRTMRERAVVIASGLMAGGALGGVFGAALRLLPAPDAVITAIGWKGALLRALPRYAESRIKTPFYDNETISQGVSMVFFVGLCLYLWIDSTRKVKEN
ncbi:MAG TPA: oligopeptide transporter, OPT family [Thermoanaerobaculia bacterium]|nr:oligopeptide transporter, OPT family [Thermoanaerobaculia bacterium]